MAEPERTLAPGGTPHELNHDFAWHTVEAPYRLITEQQAHDYDELGYFVLEDAFDPETTEAVIAEIDPFERELEDACCASSRTARRSSPEPTRSPSPPIS